MPCVLAHAHASVCIRKCMPPKGGWDSVLPPRPSRPQSCRGFPYAPGFVASFSARASPRRAVASFSARAVAGVFARRGRESLATVLPSLTILAASFFDPLSLGAWKNEAAKWSAKGWPSAWRLPGRYTAESTGTVVACLACVFLLGCLLCSAWRRRGSPRILRAPQRSPEDLTFNTSLSKPHFQNLTFKTGLVPGTERPSSDVLPDAAFVSTPGFPAWMQWLLTRGPDFQHPGPIDFFAFPFSRFCGK